MVPPRPTPVLDTGTRLRALAQSGLSSASDPGMEHYAHRVRERLGVPVALVSLVEADQQVFPGMVGLTDPWATARCTPLSHSICQYVVAGEQPLVIDDAAVHPWVRDSRAVTELGVAAYAGIPLTDGDGQVLGSLCAIDTAPRRWSVAELETLADLAHGCSMELRLRLAGYDASEEIRHRDESETVIRAALGRSETLLAASQWLAQVSTVADVRARVAELMSTELAPSYVSMALLGRDGILHRVVDQAGRREPGGGTGRDLDAPMTSSVAVRERRVVQYPDRAALVAEHPEAGASMDDLGLQAVVVAPMLAGEDPLGALTLGWERPRVMTPMELIVVTSITGYAAQALVRVQLLQHRISVAHELQQAMLADLPAVDGLSLGARYLPADEREEVGGDWYDVTLLPASGSSVPRPVAVGVGDIVGHDLHAATIMGQVRSMLRQASWSSACRSPAAAVTALEDACTGIGLTAAGTALLARLEPAGDASDRWRLTWTNAGQCPPLVLHGDGRTELLPDHDIMLGYRHLAPQVRRDHRITLDPGTTLLLYSDGLVERRGRHIDDGIAELRELLTTLRGRTPQEIVDTVIKTLVTDAHDDTVALTVRLDQPDPCGPSAVTDPVGP